jgi:hypothetical protein
MNATSKDKVNCIIERNDITELKQFHEEYGIGKMTRENYNYHVKCFFDHLNSKNGFDSKNRANAMYWSYRAKILDTIISHPMYRRSEKNIPCVTMQLMEVN